MDWADTTACLGVIMQSNIKFDEHMALEDKASRTQEAINFKQAHYYFKTSPHKMVGYWLTLVCVIHY